MEESDSEDGRPVVVAKPKPRTRHIADEKQRSTLCNSPPTPSGRSLEDHRQRPSKSMSRRHRQAKQVVHDQLTSTDVTENPKPKPRTLPSSMPNSASPAKPIPPEVPSTSAAAKLKMETEAAMDRKKYKKKARQRQHSSPEDAADGTLAPIKTAQEVEPMPTTARSAGGDAESSLNIRDILHAFQDDVVNVKSLQRNQWEERLEPLLFPELDQRHFDSLSGWDRRASVPSKWKSAASLIPHDTAASSTDNIARNSAISLFHRASNGLSCFSFFSSGILCGLLIWKAVFAMSQMLASNTFDLSPFFWIIFWTLTTLLLLVTILGFLNSANSNLMASWLLRCIPCLLIFGTYYLSKAFDLQRSECQKFLDIPKQYRHSVNETYTCDLSVAGIAWNDLTFWKMSLDFFPALGTIIVYMFFHFKIQRQRLSDSAATLSTHLGTA